MSIFLNKGGKKVLKEWEGILSLAIREVKKDMLKEIEVKEDNVWRKVFSILERSKRR
jgi:hypothetical protein